MGRQRTYDKELGPLETGVTRLNRHQVGDATAAPTSHQLSYPQHTISILESSVNLRRHPSPVSGPTWHRTVHTPNAGMETPVVPTSEEVDLVLLRTPDQGSMDWGPHQAQL